MKPSQQLAAMAVAGLCGTALSLPQIPYYTSRFPQHPQNLGYGGDYPKYWQGEAYSPPQEAPTYYNPAIGLPASPAAPAAPVAPALPLSEERPSFTDRKYPAREAIKYYGGNQFPVNEEETPNEADKNVQNVKVKNDTPAPENDKSFMRITKPHGLGGIGRRRKAALESEEASDKKPGGLESIADIAVPEFNGATENKGDEGEPENWNSFTFGVVSDTLVYHDPYEDRGGDFERKTNAMEKIEMMMGLDYSKKDAKNRRSLSKRDWPEHIQEKARKMMDSATNMQAKGQKTIENDPAYQESLKAKNPTPEPAAAPPKSTFPVAPKSKNPPPAPPKQPQPPTQPQKQPKKKPVGSGGGSLVPPGKSGKLGRAKNQPPQQQEPRPQPNQSQPQGPRPPSSPNQLGQKQPSQPRPNRDMAKKTGNSKQPQQGNFPSQGLPRKGTKGSGLNTPNKRPQNPQKNTQPQNSQKKPAQSNKKPQQKPQQKPQPNPQNKLRKRQVPVPAGPGYPPGTMIIRRPYVPPQGAFAAQNVQRAAAPLTNQISDGQLQNQGQFPTVQQIPDGQIQRQYTQQIAQIPAPAAIPVPIPAPIHMPVPAPAPFVIQQNFPAPIPAAPPAIQRAAERKETVQFAAIVHPGQVICPENKPCPQPQPEYIEKTVMQPVQKIREIPVTREAVRAVPKLEAVDVVREIDVVKEPVCESCERAKLKTITVCAECRELVDECTCYEDNRGRDSESYSRSFSNGREANAYSGPGPVSGPGGLEAFFRQRMPEHFS